MKTTKMKILIAGGLLASAALYGAVASAMCGPVVGPYPGGKCCGNGTTNNPQACAWGTTTAGGTKILGVRQHPAFSHHVSHGWGQVGGWNFCHAETAGETAWSGACPSNTSHIQVAVLHAPH